MTDIDRVESHGEDETPIARPPRGTGRRLHGAVAHKLGTAI